MQEVENTDPKTALKEKAVESRKMINEIDSRINDLREERKKYVKAENVAKMKIVSLEVEAEASK